MYLCSPDMSSLKILIKKCTDNFLRLLLEKLLRSMACTMKDIKVRTILHACLYDFIIKAFTDVARYQLITIGHISYVKMYGGQ